MIIHRQLYVIPKVERSWKKRSNRKKKVWKVDLLAIKLMHTMQGIFPITLACYLLEEEDDKRSLRSITTEN